MNDSFDSLQKRNSTQKRLDLNIHQLTDSQADILRIMNRVQKQNLCSKNSSVNDIFKSQPQYIFKWPKIKKPKIENVKNTLE